MDSEFQLENLKKVAEYVETKDLILITSVPITLILIFLLPVNVQEVLVVNYENPSLVNFLTTAFVHSDFSHLAGNLASYVLIIASLYLMCALSGLKRNFRYAFAVFVLAFPFVISMISSQFLSVETSRGFSGVGSAFLGFLPVVVFHYMDERLDLNLGIANSMMLFLIGTEVLVFIYDGLSPVFLMFLGLIGFYSWKIWRMNSLESLKEAVDKKGHFELSLFSIFLFLVLTFALFPRDIVVGGKAVNILSHYSGYFLGFFMSYFWFQIKMEI